MRALSHCHSPVDIARREPRFNKVPADIVEVGFVEVPQLFSAKTCSTLLQLADRPAAKSAKPISNALQLDVKGRAELLVARAVRDSAVVKNTMLAVYQTEHFMVENVKVSARVRPAPCSAPT